MVDCIALPDNRETANLGLVLIIGALGLEALAVVGSAGASTIFHAGVAAAGIAMLIPVCLDVLGFWIRRITGTGDGPEGQP